MSALLKETAQPAVWWALQYARTGWAVLPIRPGAKTPLLTNWQDRATTEPAMIRELWARTPRAGIGIHCGKSGLVVVDIDPRNGGNKTLAEIEAVQGPLWDTGCLIARTAGAGLHHVFRAPEGRELPHSLGAGADLLHGNHYFIVEPSIGPSGKAYLWDQGPFDADALAAMPELPACFLPASRQQATEPAPSPLAYGDAESNPAMSLAWSDSTVEDTPAERARAMAALCAIDPACSRKTYLDVLMGMCSTGWHDATDIARTWASGGLHDREEASFNERNFNSDVKALDPDGGITYATVIHLAKLGGFDASRAVPAAHVETFGDISNGQRFAAKYRAKLLYVHALRKWLLYDGTRWLWCSNGEALKAAQQIAVEALDAAHAALRADPTDRAKSNHTQALAVHRNARRLDAMLTVAASQDGMSIASPAMLDVDPYMMGVKNGVVNLRTGGMLTPDPGMMITRQAGAAFDAGAECPQWLAFLESVFNGDREYINFLQRVVGYSLTGLVDEEILVFLQGKGANGKSVLGNVLHSLFGDYAVTVRASMLARDPRGSNGEAERDKARLPGARMVLINEVGQNDIWNDQMVKELVSRERVAARPLYGESFEFMPTHTIFVRGNHDPVAMDTGDGFWRRVVVLRFSRQFAEHERVPDLDRRLLETERDGILAWAVRGCLDWQRGGLNVPASIRKASEKYRQDSDQLGLWLEDCCLCDAGAETPVAHLFASYCAFLTAGGMKTPSRPAFGRQLASKGFEAGRTMAVRFVRGVALADLGGEWAEQ